MSNIPNTTAARRQIQRSMRLIVSRDRSPYRAGLRIWATAMPHASESNDGMWALWLLWGALTDWVEVKPAETAQAESAMRRAAHEWLSLPDDAEAERAYFDRWLYEELGYERPEKPKQPKPAS